MERRSVLLDAPGCIREVLSVDSFISYLHTLHEWQDEPQDLRPFQTYRIFKGKASKVKGGEYWVLPRYLIIEHQEVIIKCQSNSTDLDGLELGLALCPSSIPVTGWTLPTMGFGTTVYPFWGPNNSHSRTNMSTVIHRILDLFH